MRNLPTRSRRLTRHGTSRLPDLISAVSDGPRSRRAHPGEGRSRSDLDGSCAPRKHGRLTCSTRSTRRPPRPRRRRSNRQPAAARRRPRARAATRPAAWGLHRPTPAEATLGRPGARSHAQSGLISSNRRPRDRAGPTAEGAPRVRRRIPGGSLHTPPAAAQRAAVYGLSLPPANHAPGRARATCAPAIPLDLLLAPGRCFIPIQPNTHDNISFLHPLPPSANGAIDHHGVWGPSRNRLGPPHLSHIRVYAWPARQMDSSSA